MIFQYEQQVTYKSVFDRMCMCVFNWAEIMCKKRDAKQIDFVSSNILRLEHFFSSYNNWNLKIKERNKKEWMKRINHAMSNCFYIYCNEVFCKNHCSHICNVCMCVCISVYCVS